MENEHWRVPASNELIYDNIYKIATLFFNNILCPIFLGLRQIPLILSPTAIVESPFRWSDEANFPTRSNFKWTGSVGAPNQTPRGIRRRVKSSHQIILPMVLVGAQNPHRRVRWIESRGEKWRNGKNNRRLLGQIHKDPMGKTISPDTFSSSPNNDGGSNQIWKKGRRPSENMALVWTILAMQVKQVRPWGSTRIIVSLIGARPQIDCV